MPPRLKRLSVLDAVRVGGEARTNNHVSHDIPPKDEPRRRAPAGPNRSALERAADQLERVDRDDGDQNDTGGFDAIGLGVVESGLDIGRKGGMSRAGSDGEGDDSGLGGNGEASKLVHFETPQKKTLKKTMGRVKTH